MINKNMPNGQSMCCALQDHLWVDPPWQNANPSPTACEILFRHWVLTDRNVLPSLTPIERLTCPLLWCGLRFVDDESLLRHLRDCPKLPASEYWCPRCHQAESFATTKIPEVIPRLDNHSPVHKKPSGLRKLFCKHFSRKRATYPREDPTTKPEPFLEEMTCNQGLGMNTHGLPYHPRLYNTDPREHPTTKPEPFQGEMPCNQGLGMNTHGLPQHPRLYNTDPREHPTTKPEPFLEEMPCNQGLGMDTHGLHHDPGLSNTIYELDSRNGLVEMEGNSPVKFVNDSSLLFSDSPPELPAQSQQLFLFIQSEVADSGANESSYAPISSRFPDRVSGQPDPPSYENEYFSEPENPSNSPANLDSAPRSVLSGYGSAPVPSQVPNCMKLTMDPQLASTTMNVSGGFPLPHDDTISITSSPQNSPLSASSSQTNTTWSGESTVTALNSVTTFIGLCSPNSASPQHISKSSAKSSGSSPKGKFHCQSCGRNFTDRANLGRHKKRHSKLNTIPCRAGCGIVFAGARTDNEGRHFNKQLDKELKENETEFRGLVHLEYVISMSKGIRCRADCGVLFTHDNEELTHYNTQVEKEQMELEGYRIHLAYSCVSGDSEALGLDSPHF